VFSLVNLEKINVEWFESINAPQNAPELVVSIAKFFAVDLLYALPIFLLLYWFFGNEAKKEVVLKSIFVMFISLCVGQIVLTLFPHPRPFTLGLGSALLYHTPNSSFPSHHMTFFCSVTISFFLAKNYTFGVILSVLSLLVAWSRIYLGVHFPFDMVGALFISLCVALLFEPVWQRIRKVIMGFSMALYTKISRILH